MDQLVHPLSQGYPGRLVFLGVNLLIALTLMEANNVHFLKTPSWVFTPNCGMAWVVVVASHIVFNKYLLKPLPEQLEFRRARGTRLTPSASA